MNGPKWTPLNDGVRATRTTSRTDLVCLIETLAEEGIKLFVFLDKNGKFINETRKSGACWLVANTSPKRVTVVCYADHATIRQTQWIEEMCITEAYG